MTIQLKVRGQIAQSLPLAEAEIECLIRGLRLVPPGTQRIERLIDLLEQLRDGGQGELARRTKAGNLHLPAPLERRIHRG